MICEFCLAKANTGSTRHVLIRGYWNCQDLVRCADKVSWAAVCRDFLTPSVYTDFHALETIISGERRSDQPGALHRNSQAFSPGTGQNRFSRYLRFARGRQNRRGAPTNTPPS